MSVSNNIIAVYRAINNTVKPDLTDTSGSTVTPTLTYTLDDDGLYTITLQSTKAIGQFQFTAEHTKSIVEISYLDLTYVNYTYNTIRTGEGSILKKIGGADWVASSATSIDQFINDSGKTIEEAILPNLVTSACTELDGVFAHLHASNIDVSNWDLTNCEMIDGVFFDCDAKVIDLSNWKFGDKLVELDAPFFECMNLEVVRLTGLNGWRNAKISKINRLFWQCPKLRQVIGIITLDTSNCTYMYEVFTDCDVYNNFTFLPYWDMHNLEEFYGIVYGCKVHIGVLDYSCWNPEKCQILCCLSGMRNDIGTIYINGIFHVRNTDTLDNLFSYSKIDRIVGLENLDFTNVTHIQETFAGTTTNQSEYKKMEQWTNLMSLQYMFYLWAYSNVVTIDISNWTTATATSLDSQFEGCPYLTHVKHHPIPHTVCEADCVYYDCPNLIEATGFNNFYLVGHDSYGYSSTSCIYGCCSKLEYVDFTNVKIGYHPDPEVECPYSAEIGGLLCCEMPALKTVNLSGLRVHPDYGWFALCCDESIENFPNLTNIILNDSHSTAINYVIDGLPDRTGLEPGYLTIHNAEEVGYVKFSDAEALNWIVIDECRVLSYVLDENTQEQPNVEFEEGVENTAITAVDYYGEDDYSMITRADVDPIKVELSNIPGLKYVLEANLSKVVDYSNMFANSGIQRIDFHNFTSNNAVVNMSGMFKNCSQLKNINTFNINTSNVIDMSSMFEGTSFEVLNLTSWKTDALVDVSRMFANTSLTNLDLKGWTFENATDMFANNTALKSVNLSSSTPETINLVIDQLPDRTGRSAGLLKIKGVEDLLSINYNKASELNWIIEDNLTSHIATYTIIKGTMAIPVVDESIELKVLENELDDNTVEVVLFGSALPTHISFEGCTSLIKVDYIDLTKVSDGTAMFKGCTNLIDITNTPYLTNMTSMYEGCTSLVKIDITDAFVDAEERILTDMFKDCINLNEIYYRVDALDVLVHVINALIPALPTRTLESPGTFKLYAANVENINEEEANAKFWFFRGAVIARYRIPTAEYSVPKVNRTYTEIVEIDGDDSIVTLETFEEYPTELSFKSTAVSEVMEMNFHEQTISVSELFCSCPNIRHIDLNVMNKHDFINYYCMFCGNDNLETITGLEKLRFIADEYNLGEENHVLECMICYNESLTSDIDLSNFTGSHKDDDIYPSLFEFVAGNPKVEKIILPKNGFNVEIGNLGYFSFGNTNLKELVNIDKLDVRRLTKDASHAFEGMHNLKQEYWDMIRDLEFDYLEDCSYMFCDTNIKNFKINTYRYNTSKITSARYMFAGNEFACLESLDLSGWQGDANMNYMCEAQDNLTEVHFYDTDNTVVETFIWGTVEDCSRIGKEPGYIYINTDDTGTMPVGYAKSHNWIVTTPYREPESHEILIAEIVIPFDAEVPELNTNVEYFAIIRPSLNTKTIKYYSNAKPTQFALTNKESISDVLFVETSELTSLDDLFNGVKITKFDKSTITTTNKATSAKRMFANVKGLSAVDLSKFDLSNVLSLEDLLNGSSVNHLYLGNLTNVDAFTGLTNGANDNLNSIFIKDISDAVIINKIINELFTIEYRNTIGQIYVNLATDMSLIDIEQAESKVWNVNAGVIVAELLLEYWGSYDITATMDSDIEYQVIATRSSNGNNNICTVIANKLPTTLRFGVSGYYSGDTVVNYLDISNLTTFNKMFYGLYITEIKGIEDWDTSKITDMSYVFYENKLRGSLNLSKWDVSQVTDMSYMFYGNYYLTELDLTGWEIGKVANLSNMFMGCSELVTLKGLSDWDTSKVTNMSYLFGECSSIRDFSFVENWNVESLVDASYMFYYCFEYLENIDLSKWNAKALTNMSYMFYYCTALRHIVLFNCDNTSAKNAYYMFGYCKCISYVNLSSIYCNFSDTSRMFYNCYELIMINIKDCQVFSSSSYSRMFYNCNGFLMLEAHGASKAAITNFVTYAPRTSSRKGYVFMDSSVTSSVTTTCNNNYWYAKAMYVYTVALSTSKTQCSYYPSTGELKCFYTLAYTDANTSSTKYVLFTAFEEILEFNYFCFYYLTSVLKLVYLDISHVKCLSSLILGSSYITDLCNIHEWDTSHIEDFNHSFSEAVLYPYHKRYFEKFDTSSCTNFFGTFNDLCFKNSESDGILKETFDLSNWDVSNATTFEYMFRDTNVEKIDISNWKNKEYADASGMFYKSDMKELIANNTLLKAEYIYQLFGNCCYLKSMDMNFIDHIGEGLSELFTCCESLTEIDLSSLNVSNVLYVDYAFDYCYALEKLNLSNWKLDLLRDTALAENDFESYTECIFDESPSIKHITLDNSTTKTINTFIELVPERFENDMGTITGSVNDANEEIKVEFANSKYWTVFIKEKAKEYVIKLKNQVVRLYHKGKKLI